MIIWGSTGRQIELESGEFYCPVCDGPQDYRLMRACRYFTLYFIPLFQTRTLGEYVECETCGGCFELDVLDYEGPSAEDRLLAHVRSAVESGLPLHMVMNKLSRRGLDKESCRSLIKEVLDGNEAKCAECGFTYGPSVKECGNCGCELDSFWV